MSTVDQPVLSAAHLTARERDVLSLMAHGLTNRAIARRLWVSERTVESHVTSVFAKLAISAGADAHRRVLAVLAFVGATPLS
ncbi:hypothetical protein GCM10009775_25960 [Microbacterium aoyamense]|uniref:HTH luxR-type domain-containing protein n=1 Tax=Microbacterium aoyamense TaxID=344166 RepID=A0ABP5B832_9MICO|nr:helix-turn-helix transcriptional regulator [Microbacterium aoyamense]